MQEEQYYLDTGASRYFIFMLSFLNLKISKRKLTKEVGIGKDMLLEKRKKDPKRKRSSTKESHEDGEKKNQIQKKYGSISAENVEEEDETHKRRKVVNAPTPSNSKSTRKSPRKGKTEKIDNDKDFSTNIGPSNKKIASKVTLRERLSTTSKDSNEENTDDENEMKVEADNQTDEEEEDFGGEGREESDDNKDEAEIEKQEQKSSGTKKRSSRGNENSDGQEILDDPIVFQPSPREIMVSSSFSVQDNLSKVLAQSIKATDESMMEQCLLCTDESMISRTIQYLPSDMASLFLHQIIVRVDKKPNRADQLLIWIKYILLYHASALSNNEKWISDLQTLESITSKRGANYQRLLGLSGRLEMLLAQVDRVRTTEKFSNRADDSLQHTIIFQDEDNSDDEDNIGNRTLLLRYN